MMTELLGFKSEEQVHPQTTTERHRRYDVWNGDELLEAACSARDATVYDEMGYFVTPSTGYGDL